MNIDLDYLKNVFDTHVDETTESLKDFDDSFNQNKELTDQIDQMLNQTNNDLEDTQDNDYKSYISEHVSSFYNLDEDISKRVVDNSDYIYDENSNLVMIYNTEAFSKFGIRTDYSYDDIAKVIDNSIRIGDEYKEIIKDFVKQWIIFMMTLIGPFFITI